MPPRPTPLDDTTRAAVLAHWAHAARADLNAAVILRETGERARLHAVEPTLCAALDSAARDAERHAALAGTVLTALGEATPTQPPYASTPGHADAAHPADVLLWDVTYLLAAGRTVGATITLATVERATVPEVVRVLNASQRDQLRAASLGWSLVDALARLALLRKEDASTIARVATHAAMRATADAELAVAGREVAVEAWGVLPASTARAAARAALTTQVIPSLVRRGLLASSVG